MTPLEKVELVTLLVNVILKQNVLPVLSKVGVAENVTVEQAVVGFAQVASPRQKVEEDALVPEFRLVTGTLPSPMVPVVVIVPPVMGEVVAMLVTVPDPPLLGKQLLPSDLIHTAFPAELK